MAQKKDKNEIGEETGSGSGKHSVWLPDEIITVLRLNAMLAQMGQKEYLNEIVITWLVHRKTVKEEKKINLRYTYPYPYIQIPTNTEDAKFSNYTLYLERNTLAWLRQFSREDNVKLTTVLYTALYLGLVGADWVNSIGHYYSLKKNKPPKWPI